MVSLLAEAGSDLECGGAYRETTPLCLAAALGQTAVVSALLDAGVHPEARNEMGYLSLVLAATAGRAGHPRAVDLLLGRGAGIDAEMNGRIALGWAADSIQEDMVRHLLNRGATPVPEQQGQESPPLLRRRARPAVLGSVRRYPAVSGGARHRSDLPAPEGLRATGGISPAYGLRAHDADSPGHPWLSHTPFSCPCVQAPAALLGTGAREPAQPCVPKRRTAPPAGHRSGVNCEPEISWFTSFAPARRETP